MGTRAPFYLHQKVDCGGYVGEVVVIVPPVCNPFRMIQKRLGNVKVLRISKARNDSPRKVTNLVNLREEVSYVVKCVANDGGTEYRWPHVRNMRAVE